MIHKVGLGPNSGGFGKLRETLQRINVAVSGEQSKSVKSKKKKKKTEQLWLWRTAAKLFTDTQVVAILSRHTSPSVQILDVSEVSVRNHQRAQTADTADTR